MSRYIFTSESVAPGHPDKTCDAISDALLDFVLEKDPFARCAFEAFVTKDNVIIGGETRISNYTLSQEDVESVIRETLKNIGHDFDGFSYKNVKIKNLIHSQSPDIAIGVDESDGKEEGAGDQGIMFGYACNETPEFMPMAIMLSHKILKNIWNKKLVGLGPDAKSQVSLIYENGKPVGCHSVTVSIQHLESISLEKVREMVLPVIEATLPLGWMPAEDKIYINPTGRFVIGGPVSDTGLTGRKIIVDTYGGAAPHGGGAFCVDGDTEYMESPGVWKKMSEYNGGDVSQWNNGVLEFVKPEQYIKVKADKMYRFTSHNIDMALSENHDVVYVDENYVINKIKVKNIINDLNFKGRIPCGFEYINQEKHSVDSKHIKLKVIACLLGRLSGKDIILSTVTSWISRIVETVLGCGLELSVTKNQENNLCEIKIPLEMTSLSFYDNFKNSNKFECEEILSSIKEFFPSVRFSYEKKFWCFTRDKKDADFIQFLFMSLKYKSSVIRNFKIDEFFEVIGFDYKEIILNEDVIREDFTPEDGMMYCFSVPSGMLLLRRNNKIFVTGNSGKDPTKVDRSAAYMARYIAKNIVASGLAEKCLVQLSYVIGVSKPTSVLIDDYYTGVISNKELVKLIESKLDLSPKGIRTYLGLNAPIYSKTSTFGHFGRDDVSWEKVDLFTEEEIKSLLEINSFHKPIDK